MASNHDDPVRVILWTFPRTISTALTKCLSHIEDIEVWFEPYCFCDMAAREYRRVHGRELPTAYEGNEEAYAEAARLVSRVTVTPPGVIDPQRLAIEGVKSRLEQSSSKYVLVKDMAHCLTRTQYTFLPSGYRHAFLTRRSAPAIASYRKATLESFIASGYLPDEARDDHAFDIERDNFLFNAGLFHERLCLLWRYISKISCREGCKEQSVASPDSETMQSCATIAWSPIIIDSDDLLAKPHEVLPKFCRAVGLPFSGSLLEWDPSPEFAYRWNMAGEGLIRHNVHFYRRALESARFDPPSPGQKGEEDVTEDVRRLSERAQPFYQEMNACKL